MKKTQVTELFRNIKNTRISYIAIIIFVALTVGFFSGMRCAVGSLKMSMEHEYEEGFFHDYDITYPYGFDEDFIEDFEQKTGSEAEGYFEGYHFARINDKKLQVKVVSINENIDRPIRVDGVLPQKNNEAAIGSFYAEENGLKIGDRISFDDFDGMTTDSFTITAFVSSAATVVRYDDANGYSPIALDPVKATIYTTREAFEELPGGGYLKLAVRCSELRSNNSFSDEYKETVDEKKDEIFKQVTEYTDEKNAVLSRVLPAAEPVIVTRKSNSGYSGFNTILDTFSGLRLYLTAHFLIIGLLVCYTATMRLVFDQSVLIGTKKALGFHTKSIVVMFLLYAGSAALIGSVIGVMLGQFVIQYVAVATIRASYAFGTIVPDFILSDILLCTATEIILTMLTGFLACYSITRRPAQNLLVGEVDESSEKNRKLLHSRFMSKFALFSRAVIRNLYSDRRRVISTVIGIVGCTSLIVTSAVGFLNVKKSFVRNFEEVTRFNTIIYFDGSEKACNDITDCLDKYGIEYTLTQCFRGYVDMNSEDGLLTIYVVPDRDFYRFMNLYDMDSGIIQQAESGALIDHNYIKHSENDDTVDFTISNGNRYSMDIQGSFEYYLMNHVLLTSGEYFEEVFGKEYIPNTLLFNADEEIFGLLESEMAEIEGFGTINDYYKESKNAFDAVAIVGEGLMLMYMALSIILAVLVLLNIFVVHIKEKKKELFVLRINGFDTKKVRKYIIRDEEMLAIPSLIIGIIIGDIVGKAELDAIGNNAIEFIIKTNPFALLCGGLLSAGLVIIMSVLALRELRSLDSRDS